MRTIFLLLIGVIALNSCQVTKLVATENKTELQKELVDKRTFKSEFEWANPLQTNGLITLTNTNLIAPGNTVTRFNISQTNAYLIMKGDSVDVSLPYFGERRMGGGYGNDKGITYRGKVDDIKVEFDEKHKDYQISFLMQTNTESFDVSIHLFSNLSTQLYISTSHRSAIRYEGSAFEIPE